MGLLNPCQVISDSVALGHRCAVLVGKLMKGEPSIGPYEPDCSPVQFRLMVSVAALPLVITACLSANSLGNAALAAGQASASLNAVPRVVGIGAKQQVIGIDAGRIVAGMPDQNPIWYVALEQVVADAVPRVNGFPVELQLNRRIPLGVGGFLPDPAPTVIYHVAAVETADKVLNTHSDASVMEDSIISEHGRKV